MPRAHNTQALSGAGFLKMINRATDSLSKMTIKMDESDVVSLPPLTTVTHTQSPFDWVHSFYLARGPSGGVCLF